MKKLSELLINYPAQCVVMLKPNSMIICERVNDQKKVAIKLSEIVLIEEANFLNAEGIGTSFVTLRTGANLHIDQPFDVLVTITAEQVI